MVEGLAGSPVGHIFSSLFSTAYPDFVAGPFTMWIAAQIDGDNIQSIF